VLKDYTYTAATVHNIRGTAEYCVDDEAQTPV